MNLFLRLSLFFSERGALYEALLEVIAVLQWERCALWGSSWGCRCSSVREVCSMRVFLWLSLFFSERGALYEGLLVVVAVLQWERCALWGSSCGCRCSSVREVCSMRLFLWLSLFFSERGALYESLLEVVTVLSERGALYEALLEVIAVLQWERCTLWGSSWGCRCSSVREVCSMRVFLWLSLFFSERGVLYESLLEVIAVLQ